MTKGVRHTTAEAIVSPPNDTTDVSTQRMERRDPEGIALGVSYLSTLPRRGLQCLGIELWIVHCVVS